MKVENSFHSDKEHICDSDTIEKTTFTLVCPWSSNKLPQEARNYCWRKRIVIRKLFRYLCLTKEKATRCLAVSTGRCVRSLRERNLYHILQIFPTKHHPCFLALHYHFLLFNTPRLGRRLYEASSKNNILFCFLKQSLNSRHLGCLTIS